MRYVLCVLVAALALTGAALASGTPSGITERVLADGKVAKHFTIDVSKSGDVLVASAKLSPGASFGWHTHRSAVAVAVTAGTLTLYDSDNPGCAPQRIRAGHGFVEQANHVHLARNEGKKPVRLVATYLGTPHGLSPDLPATQPAGCSVS
jgi:quercetin dioxygenase-like cupin family protein